MAEQVGLLAEIRERRAKLLEEHRFVHLELPYWPGLTARYRRLTSRAEKAQVLEQVSPDLDDVTGEMELMLRANAGVLARDDDGYDHLIVDDQDQPLTFGSRDLARRLGLDAESPHELILQLFADADGRTDTDAVAAHADRLAAWMDRTSREVDVRLVGESRADETSVSSHGPQTQD